MEIAKVTKKRGGLAQEPDFAKLGDATLGKLRWVNKPDDDPALVEYIRACPFAANLVHLAVEKPFCLFSESPRFHSKTHDGALMQLGRSLVALGRVRLTESPSMIFARSTD